MADGTSLSGDDFVHDGSVLWGTLATTLVSSVIYVMFDGVASLIHSIWGGVGELVFGILEGISSFGSTLILEPRDALGVAWSTAAENMFNVGPATFTVGVVLIIMAMVATPLVWNRLREAM